MIRFKPLPGWIMTGTRPSVYDSESATALEQTAKVYGAMNELIDDYNKLVEELNTKIDGFIESTNKDQEEFKASIDKIVHDYIKMLDEKVKLQDSKIDEAVLFMKDNLSASITTVIGQMKESGELDEAVLNAIDNIGDRVTTLENTEYTLVYEDGTENLILQKTIKVGE